MQHKRYYSPKKNVSDLQLLYGRHPITEALEEGTSFEKLVMAKSVHGEFAKTIRTYSKERNIPLHIQPKENLTRITSKNHQGILGYLAHIDYYKLEDVIPTIYEKGETPIILVLDEITDVRNFGAIARSAEATGAHALVIPTKNAAQINSEALKTAAGALNNIPVCRESSLDNCLDFLKLNGITIAAADLSGSKQLFEVDFTQPIAIIFGAEGRAVRPHLLRKTEECFQIPMKGQSNSFNVSVAAGITLYETIRQRMKV